MKKIISLLIILLLVFFLASFDSKSANSNSFTWETELPQNLNLKKEKIDTFLNSLKNTEVTSCIIVKDGKIACEYYKTGYNQNSTFAMHSVSKSITSAVTGIAIQNGYFNLDDPITKFFPELKEKKDKRYEKITVRELLRNTSGLVSTDSGLWGEWRKSDDWIQFLFDRAIKYDPGKTFEYSTGNTHIISAIIQKTTGKTLYEYGKKVLFEPLGLKSARIDKAPEGICDGGNGAYLTARDMARFGLLYLNKGKWLGKQLIPEEWIDESVKIQTPNMARYGYQWWIRWFGKKELRGFFAHGWGEQVIAVIPQANLIITFSSRYPNNNKNSMYWNWIGNIVDAVN